MSTTAKPSDSTSSRKGEFIAIFLVFLFIFSLAMGIVYSDEIHYTFSDSVEVVELSLETDPAVHSLIASGVKKIRRDGKEGFHSQPNKIYITLTNGEELEAYGEEWLDSDNGHRRYWLVVGQSVTPKGMRLFEVAFKGADPGPFETKEAFMKALISDINHVVKLANEKKNAEASWHK